jgi:glucosamine--fructose-6-phosphate aminotransferase (isomerizing)
MCGIAGAYGPNALRIALLITLAQLNRGTQGAGLAWVEANRIKILKEPTHPIAFARKYYHRLNPRIAYAISHNRQPSRGGVSYNNTHPFLSCDRSFALIHNGSCVFDKEVISDIKRRHKVRGETDSEVIMHMLEDFYDEYDDMRLAMEELNETDFSGAILVITKDGEIYGTRKGWAPLHYARLGNHVYLASEAEAIRSIVEDRLEVMRLRSKQIIRINKGAVKVYGEGEEEPVTKVYTGSYYYAPRRYSSPYYPWYYDYEL